MTTLTTVRTPVLAARPAAVPDHGARCTCGQELDCCATEYCPRCGHELRDRGRRPR